MNAEQRTERSGRETGRVEAFSDGVFAIAITLLILEIRVPYPHDLPADGNLKLALERLWPSFVSFVLSFVFILIGWINHHRLFTHIRRIDGPFLFLNGFLLLVFTFVPFPTALLGAYIQHPQARVAAVVYCGTCLLVAISYQALWRYASHRNRLLKLNANNRLTAQITREYNRSFPVFVLAFILAFFNTVASIGLVASLMVFFSVTGFTATDSEKV